MTTPATTPAAFALSARILCGALMGALVLMGLVLFFVLPSDETPPIWVPLAQVVAAVVVHVGLETIGYRIAPLESALSDDEAAAEARTRWQSSMMVRFALSEAIAIGSIALAFVVDGGIWVYLVGAAVSLVLMWIHVWPGARSVGRTADALEAGGRASHLRETFGASAPGPIQQF
ncbi:hypothetical protein [Knoellia subterranea]|uniref:Uncharacterized protein n=1 Tax=Knoellia subterranea KCTC 19937 TaxID=1385521 RepID=A0A0A0JFB6_9MICO|nr:hypothetical protein [Knoellia subterranea]KGN36090.1 hypothetical protein N803_09330 [Knoellia subterranea KCTC 19937]